jgi:hypothetical protein
MHELADVAVATMEITFEASVIETLPTMTYDVVRHRGHWKVLHVGRHSASHPSQKSAIDSAVKLAMESRAAGRAVLVRLNRTDGRIFDLTETMSAAAI